MDYNALFQQSGAQYGVDPDLLRSVAKVESNFNPTATSPVGAKGLMQMMPETAKSLGIDPNNAAQSIDGGARLLKENLTRYGNIDDAVRAYHGGTNQKNWGAKTEDYVNKVSTAFNGLKSNNGIDTQVQPQAPVNSDVDAWLGAKSTQQTAQPQQAQSVDDWLGANAKPVQSMPQAQTAQTSSLPTAQSNSPLVNNINDGIQAFGHHLMNMPHGIANLVENGASKLSQYVSPNSSFSNAITNVANKDNQAAIDSENQYQKNVPDSAGAYIGATAGEVAPFIAGGAAKGLQGIGDAVAGLTSKVLPKFAAQAVGGAAQGAAVSLASPVTGTGDYWENKENQLKGGLAFGAAAPMLGNAITRIISPKTSDAYSNLASAGVNTTIGQRFGSVANSVEEKLQSIPLIGDFISKGRNNALNSYNVSTLNNVLSSVGRTVSQAGQEGVKQAGDIISNSYEKGKSLLGGFSIDSQAQGQIQALRDGVNSATNLTAQGKKQVSSMIDLLRQNT